MKGSTVRFSVFLLFTVVLTGFIGAQIANVQFADQYPLQARFGDVTGLFEGDPVRIAGVPVGIVERIGVEDGEAVVGFTVDQGIALPSDSRVEVSWLDLIGARQLDIHPGTAATTLEPGDEITDTRSAIDIGALTAELGPLARTLDPAELNELLQSVFEVLDGNEQVVVETVTDARVLLSAVTSRDDVVQQLLTDYADVASTLADRESQIRHVIADLTLLAETFARTDELIVQGLDDAASVAEGTKGFLDLNADDLATLIEGLDSLVATFSEQSETLDEVLVGLPDSLRAFFAVGDRGDMLTVHGYCVTDAEPPCPNGGGAGGQSSLLGSVRPVDDTAALQALLLGGGS